MAAGVDSLIVGLGNIGSAYRATRHNIGFRVADAVCERLKGATRGTYGEADYTAGTLFSNMRVLVVKPRTLMNRSGEAVKRYLDTWPVPSGRMLVVVDDYQLPLGKIRARAGGSDGGHNGLKSIAAMVGEDYPRLRVGIGPAPASGTAIDFVLGDFTGAEEALLAAVVPRAAEACELFVHKDVQSVMNTFNGK